MGGGDCLPKIVNCKFVWPFEHARHNNAHAHLVCVQFNVLGPGAPSCGAIAMYSFTEVELFCLLLATVQAIPGTLFLLQGAYYYYYNFKTQSQTLKPLSKEVLMGPI